MNKKGTNTCKRQKNTQKGTNEGTKGDSRDKKTRKGDRIGDKKGDNNVQRSDLDLGSWKTLAGPRPGPTLD